MIYYLHFNNQQVDQMDNIGYSHLEKAEEREKEYYSKYHKFFHDTKWMKEKYGSNCDPLNYSKSRIIDAFRIRIGDMFFYYVIIPYRNSDEVIYRDGNLDLDYIKNTFIERMLSKFKLYHAHCVEEFQSGSVWWNFWRDYINTRRIRIDNSKVVSLETLTRGGYEEIFRLVTIKAIPPEILCPLSLPMNQFSFNSIEDKYVKILDACESLFFLKNWMQYTNKREYFFISETGYDQMMNIIEGIFYQGNINLENLSDEDVNILNNVKVYHLIFDDIECIIEEYKWEKDGINFSFKKKIVEKFKNSSYFESYVAGMLVFSMKMNHDNIMWNIIGMLEQSTFHYPELYKDIYGYNEEYRDREFDKNGTKCNPFNFYLNFYPKKYYCYRSQIKEMYDRHELYYTLKKRKHSSLKSISENTFITLPNSRINNLMYTLVNEKKESIKLYEERWKGMDFDAMIGVYGEVLEEAFLNTWLSYEYSWDENNELDEDGEPILNFYDPNRSFQKELIQKVFYKTDWGFCFE